MDRILLFHLSDLHFGSSFTGTAHATTGFQTGLNGHGLTISQKLPVALRRAIHGELKVTSADVVEYLISGDLTRTGNTSDFQLAYTYLFSRLHWLPDRHGPLEQMGLNLPMAKTHCVPGNHDHWNGQSSVSLWSPPPAFNATIFPDLMEATIVEAPGPSPHHTIRSKNGQIICELFRVDSNEGLQPSGTNLKAAGRLSDTQLEGVFGPSGEIITKGLAQQMQEAAAAGQNDQIPRVAAIACHHSLGSKNGLTGAQPLEGPSVSRLFSVIRRFQNSFPIRAVLTGHTHYSTPWVLPDPASANRVWELRCASTLQMDPQPGAQGFLVHEISVTPNGQPTWNMWTFSWNGLDFVKRPTAVAVT